jgi:hypothetical protein
MGAEPETGPTDPTGRGSGRDHSSLNVWRRSQHRFRSYALYRLIGDPRIIPA